jgi:hypothetical protein
LNTWRVWIESESIAVDEWSECLDDLLEALEARDDVAGVVGSGAGTSLGAVFEVDAPDVQTAADVAIEAFISSVALATKGLPAPPEVRRIEIAPEDYERDELLGAVDGARVLGVSRQRFYQLQGHPGFPTPAAELARGALWRRADIEAFAMTRQPTPRADGS